MAQFESTRLRTVLALVALAFACAVATGVTSSAGAAAKQTAHAAFYDDGYCDPYNDFDDPDCWQDGGDGNEPTAPTGPTGPTVPVAPPIQWPAPPRGAYAKLRANGRTATLPKSAPRPIKAMIKAANSITRKPYKWGGGHGKWIDRGYDCSGATSFVLRAGGYVSWPMVSGQLAKWGASGPGNWVRIYANSGHVFMVIAGLRFDTSPMGYGESGPRWRPNVRFTQGFKLRHPAGL